MNLRKSAIGQPDPDLVDAMFDAYVAWREESATVTMAYRRWSNAGSEAREAAFADYASALDHEESAAARYQCIIGHVAACRRGAVMTPPASVQAGS